MKLLMCTHVTISKITNILDGLLAVIADPKLTALPNDTFQAKMGDIIN